MSRETFIENTKKQVEASVRVFLCRYTEFDLLWNKYPPHHQKYVPDWIVKYNYLSLLNLPDLIELNGPLRGIWEGGAIGEGFLRYIKPEITNGLRFR
jgi:hypothetical protein